MAINMTYYKINEHIHLELIDGKTNIYIDNILHDQCKYLLLNIPKYETPQKTIVSIDEAKEMYSNENESNKDIISAETEFWAHCSNLEAWVNNDYNPNILHSNLSVPILKKLVLKDVKVFSSLMYHLENYWIAYETNYDKKYTKQRRQLLIEQFKEIVYKAIDIWHLENVAELSIFYLNCKLLDILPSYFPFAFDYCELCERKKKVFDDYKNGFVDITIYNDSFDDSDYTDYHICYDCYDNISEFDYEYCSNCDYTFENSNHANVVYVEAYGELLCRKCLQEALLENGIPEINQIDNLERPSIDDLNSNDWKYLITIKCENKREYEFFKDEIQEIIEGKTPILVYEVNSRYYGLHHQEFEFAIFFKSEREFWSFKK